MTETNQTLTERLTAKLNTINQRIVAKLRQRQVILEKMRSEDDFEKSMEYLKEFFKVTGEN